MELFDKLYDEQEKVKVRFVGFTTGDIRFDFGIVYSNMFFGKPLVICMQTGRSTLLEQKDTEDTEHLMDVFKLKDKKHAKDLAEFFSEALPEIPFQAQYE
ncbi:DUF3055 domain-containing protein [Peribacillus saganii]|uniref:DUF3055 domain-containing protein n=1 Tax=Peribacillus saganii TaxID=2303992 RepID=A0A372LTI6_9BACI|nr:DUF3055 domain-containing protein [Peribacillus saganii]RFU71112.1 DUF3055 domain-containing protein [Peribacillus saganii]